MCHIDRMGCHIGQKVLCHIGQNGVCHIDRMGCVISKEALVVCMPARSASRLVQLFRCLVACHLEAPSSAS